MEDIHKLLGRLEANMDSIKEDIGEIKQNIKEVKQLDLLINSPKIGIIARFEQLEKDVAEIKAYISSQKAYIALISSATGVVVTVIGFALKALFNYFFK